MNDEATSDMDAMFEAEAPEAPVEPQQDSPHVEEPAIVEDAPPVEEPQKEEARNVPLPTFLEVRDKAKEAERQRDEYKRELEEIRQRAAKPAQDTPDPYDDPDGYRAHLEAVNEQRFVQHRFEISDQMARQQHGSETVEQAVAWAQEKAQADPMFAASYMRDKNPIDWIVRQHKREALMNQVGEDPDAFVRRRAAELGYVTPTAPAQPASPPSRVPRSLASQGSGPENVTPAANHALVGIED